MKHGELTKGFGLWLTQLLEANNQYSVYYDHGNQEAESNVVIIKGFLGEKVTNANRLTDVDIMVVNNREVVLLIEIEEGTMSPKKLLGDIFSTVMCNKFAVRIENENRYFDLAAETRLIIAGVTPDQGDGLSKIEDTVMPHLRKFGFPNDALQSDKIKIVAKTDILKTLVELKNEVRSIFVVG
jgi:hypothetical protein